MNLKVWHIEYVGGETGEVEVCTPVFNVVNITYESGDLVLSYHDHKQVWIKSFGMNTVTCIRTF